MLNRYVIALNRLKLVQKQLKKKGKLGVNNELTVNEIAELMDFARRYPKTKIDKEALFTCGFSKN